jgi:hypothetical protein
MKDVMCLAALVGKVLCLVLFVATLRPQHINVVQETGKSASCRAAAPACGLRVVAAIARTDAEQCSAALGLPAKRRDC